MENQTTIFLHGFTKAGVSVHDDGTTGIEFMQPGRVLGSSVTIFFPDVASALEAVDSLRDQILQAMAPKEAA